FLSLSKKSFIFTLFLCPSPFNNICWFNITAFLYLFLSFFFILCHFSKNVSYLVSTLFTGPYSLTLPYSIYKIFWKKFFVCLRYGLTKIILFPSLLKYSIFWCFFFASDLFRSH